MTDRKRRAPFSYEMFAVESFRLITNLDPALVWADALFGSREEASLDYAPPG